MKPRTRPLGQSVPGLLMDDCPERIPLLRAGVEGCQSDRCSVGASGGDRPSISVVIPVLNEARNLPYVFAAIPDVHEVILVDGHSLDDTVKVAQELRPGVRVIRNTRPGKGNGLACGFAAATGDIIAMFDGDGSADPGEIPRFVKSLLDGADFVKGTRFAVGGGSSDITRFGALLNYLLTTIFNARYRRRYTDFGSTFNVFWRRFLPVLGLDPYSSPRGFLWGDGFEVDTLIQSRVAKAGLAVAEVPIFENSRICGHRNLNALHNFFPVFRAIMVESWWFRPRGRDVGKNIQREGLLGRLLFEINDRLPYQVTCIALKMAGRKRAYLREAWDSDLLDEDGSFLPLPTRLCHVAGYIFASVRYRLDDVGILLGCWLDSVLISRNRTYAAAGAAFTIPAAMIFSRSGLYGLIANAEALAVIFAALCASIRRLRKWRGVRPPEAKKGGPPH